MKHLLIVGARGWGREVYAAVCRTKPYIDGEFDVKGFLDSKSDAFEGLKGVYPPIISSPEDYVIQPDDVFFVAMGDSQWRKHYVGIIEKKGGSFISIIGCTAYVNPTATVGEGSFIASNSLISDNVVVGKHVVVHVFSDIGHDAKIGDFATIESYCFMGGYSELGSESIMHVRSTLIRHKKIGNNVDVGSNSLVTRNIKDGLHVFGIPATKLSF
ncbi:sugar O-acyltransferase, sialic acid O-acetyltransferase NeuD family [Fibrobacter sp. UWT3]|uniref:PglD-related sugar-binding protein n=1 Tax=Fibrobacter sp. UWT3 TaxID=1896225 RepID=UPI000BD48570|nr:sialic acid O-acetyltransferase [Fibrobacter sp. UWT3]SOE76585.1 sugar O-acyltransferase, sialic acid O-acetyltransferase NeuD family [Fibrobacter sp. UWT3]